MSSKGKLPIITGVCFLIAGIYLIWQSMLYDSTILRFISLAVTFWGSLLLAIRPKDFTKSILVSATAASSLESIDELLKTSEYTGKAVHFPPETNDRKSGRVFILNDTESIPSSKELKTNDASQKTKTISIVPPGLELVNLFEKQLKKSFTKVPLDYIVSHLPKVFIEDLEIAKKCEIIPESNTINVTLEGVIFDSLCKKISKTTSICNTIGCPFASAIACAITRATSKPVVLEKSEFSKKGKTVQITYKILGA